MESLTELFCLIDDLCVQFEPAWNKRLLTDGQKHRRRQTRLQLSELMTLALLFHQLRFRQFKTRILELGRYGGALAPAQAVIQRYTPRPNVVA